MSDLAAEVIASAVDHPSAKWPSDQMQDHELSLELLVLSR